MPSLSTSSSIRTGFFVPARRSPCTIWPGSAPMYVRRWPRISASSRMPPSELAQRLRLRFGGHASRFDLGAERVHLLRSLVAFAELLLDGLHLLTQIIVALRLAHLRLDLGLDLATELENLGLLAERGRQLREALAHVDCLEQLLLECERERGEGGGNEIGDGAGAFDIVEHRDELIGQHGRQRHDLREQ